MRLWNSRLYLRVGLGPGRPAPAAATELHASAEPELPPSVGRWFTTNFDLRAAVAVVTLLAGGITAYVSSSNDKVAAAAERRQLQTQVNALQGEIAQRDTRFNSTVVSRDEYQNILQLMILLQQQGRLCGAFAPQVAGSTR